MIPKNKIKFFVISINFTKIKVMKYEYRKAETS